jgi:3-hydroxyisobutyrate dehydrogenase-like beta-hydroxyacid dehydrogenase
MALGLKAGVDVPLMIKAIATGSGGSTQFGIRAPWMAERRFLPAQGTVPTLQHYFPMIGDFAESVGVATPLLDCAAALYERFVAMGFGEFDGAKMVDVIGSLPLLKKRLKTRTKMKRKKKTKTKAPRAKRKGALA